MRETLRRLFDRPWGAFRSRRLHSQYRRRREHYWTVARRRGLRYRECDSIEAARARIAQRGYSPVQRAIREVHTFAIIPRLGWHSALFPDLHALGPVTDFDYAALGFTAEEFFRRDESAARRRREMNALALRALRAAHEIRPVDWIFIYESGLEVTRDFLRAAREEVGVPIVNMCLDDKQSWTGPRLAGQRLGQIDIADQFDVCWTSARVACEWYLAEGAIPFYQPEGFDNETYHPMETPRDLPVSFIGAAYGFRRGIVRHLRRFGVDVHAFGPDWPEGPVWGEHAVRVMNRSVINLGMGGIGYSEDLTNVKTRDFEIPGVGGGVYLTSFNPDLAQHFRISEEILCYRNRDEMLELIRYYLAHPEEAQQIARRGRERCLAEHRWFHRYRRICEILGILEDASGELPTRGIGFQASTTKS